MKRLSRTLASQAGMAVITAMLLVALAASTATFLLWRQQLWLQQVENLASRAQADALARAALEWRRRSGSETAIGPFEAAGAVETAITDAQGLFNLNNLLRAGKPSEPDLAGVSPAARLLRLPEALADALLDAIDADSDTTFPAEPKTWTISRCSRRAARRIVHCSTSPVSGGSKASVPKRSSVFVRTSARYPRQPFLNVNSAPAEVLQALLPGLDDGASAALVTERSQKTVRHAGSVSCAPARIGPRAAERRARRLEQLFPRRQPRAERTRRIDRACARWHARRKARGHRLANEGES
jgi:general secretion pathway protein K